MIYLIIPILLYCIGGIFDAVMDTCSDHFYSSVFKNLNPSYWNKNVSWINKYVNKDPKQGFKKMLGIVIPVAFTDAWHMAKSLKEIFNCLALTAALYIDFPYSINIIILYFVVAGVLRNIIFDIFYNIILVNKK